MTSTHTTTIALVAIISIAAAFVFGAFLYTTQLVQGQTTGGANATKCITGTSARVVVGNQASTQILATSTNRAYAVVKQLENATNTTSVRLDEDIKATTITGQTLSMAAATSTRYYLEFGLNTDNPYTGAVTAITDKGSTTIEVFECNYPPVV